MLLAANAEPSSTNDKGFTACEEAYDKKAFLDILKVRFVVVISAISIIIIIIISSSSSSSSSTR